MIRFCLICFLLLFSACKKTGPEPQQVMRLSLAKDPTQFDPRKARDLYDTALTRMLFEGLTRLSQVGEVELAIADKVDVSEDGLQYVFHLRDTCWSNGDPVTAFDFCTSWKTILDPRFATDIAAQLYCIKNACKAKFGEISTDAVGVRALDPKTLVVELEHPVPYFLQLLSMTYFSPAPSKIAKQNENWSLSPETFVSNGPFLLHTWKRTDHLTLIKNPRYWEAKIVKMPQIDFFIAANDTAFRMYEEGKLDWFGSPLATIPSNALRDLKKENLLCISPFLGTYLYRLNTAPMILDKKNPLANPELRRALSCAIDREAIVGYVLQGGQMAAKSFVPPAMGLQLEERSIDRSLTLDVSLKDPLTIHFISDERNLAVAQAIQNQWEKKLGIQVELNALEPKMFYQRLSKGELQIAAGSWTADFNDPINFLEVFKYSRGSTNNTGWENRSYIDLLNRSDVCKNGEERKNLLQQAEAILMEETPIIPLFHFSSNYMKNPNLVNVTLFPLGILDFRGASFDSEEAKR